MSFSAITHEEARSDAGLFVSETCLRGSEAERLQSPLLATILRLLALAGGLGEFGRCVDRFADVMHGLTQAADGMK